MLCLIVIAPELFKWEMWSKENLHIITYFTDDKIAAICWEECSDLQLGAYILKLFYSRAMFGLELSTVLT